MLKSPVGVASAPRRSTNVGAYAFLLALISVTSSIKAATLPTPRMDANHESFCSSALRNPDGSWWVLNTIKSQQLPAGSGKVTTVAAGATVKPGEAGANGILAAEFTRFCSRQF